MRQSSRAGRRESSITSDRRLNVLQSFPPRRAQTNPYLTQLYRCLGEVANVRHFSWREALTGRYDVLHVHWPEVTARGRTPLRSVARRLLYLLVLIRVRVTRRALVRTLHNLGPHEPGPWSERAVLRLSDRWTTAWITLTPLTVAPSDAPAVTIRHGHYRDWFAGRAVPPSVRGRLLYFGLVRRYKGVAELLDVLAGATDAPVTLRVVGRCDDADLAVAFQQAADTDHRISALLEYVDDDVMAREIGGAELVVLPYREMHNSGAAMLALSLGRPVLVPANPINAALSDEVGGGWVYPFEPPLTIDAIENALAQSGASMSGAPDLTLREWDRIAAEHLAVYQMAVERLSQR